MLRNSGFSKQKRINHRHDSEPASVCFFTSTEIPPFTVGSIQRKGKPKGRPDGQKPQYIILHSTDGNEESSLNELTKVGRASVHYVTTEDGRVHHLVPEGDTAWHGGAVIKPEYQNSNTIGIEQVHIDGQPWSEDEVKATAKLAADIMRRNPQIPLENILGHNDIAPNLKQDPLNFPWARFRDYVKADLGGELAPGSSA